MGLLVAAEMFRHCGFASDVYTTAGYEPDRMDMTKPSMPCCQCWPEQISFPAWEVWGTAFLPLWSSWL
jgi:hypothetical protein